MIRDEELKQAVDYSEGQKTAAYMVLGEIVNLLDEFSDHIRIIGGWVPTLLYPESDHIGSIDVDVLLNQLEIKKAESYETNPSFTNEEWLCETSREVFYFREDSCCARRII